MIKNLHLNQKKIKDYLDTGLYKKVLLKFEHGLGDVVMFYCCVLPVLKRYYPDIEFFVKNHLGQDAIFDTCDPDESKYDISFEIAFPCAEWEPNDLTKVEKCVECELGFKKSDVVENYHFKNKIENPFIAMHFLSTSVSSFSVPEDKAMKIWNKIKSFNLVPIDTHLKHAFANKDSYSFEKRTISDINPNIKTLLNVIGTCSGFAGAISGNFWLALGLFPPEKILMLYNSNSLKNCRKLTKLPIHYFDFTKSFKENEKEFMDWINDVKMV